MKISVLPIGPFDFSFSYWTDIDVSVGDVVQVPFGARRLVGVVTDDPIDSEIELKSIDKKFGYAISYDFVDWVASYTISPRGNVLKMFLSEKTLFLCKTKTEIPKIKFNLQDIHLNEEQKYAYEALLQNSLKPFLLKGVTGSGKTEVYLSYAQYILQSGKQVLILLPEISLTSQIMLRIQKYFGAYPLVWNSNITAKSRRGVWLKAHSGEACIIIGARSALFLPFKNLGCIIIDEEQDSSYKQEDGVLYNARDMAVVLGKLRSIPVILSSATPSLESCINARTGKYAYASMTKRFGRSQLPSLSLIDMRQNKFDGYISPFLIDSIKHKIKDNEQSLIYINRRGYAPISLCKACGEKIACPNCSTWLVYHQNKNKLICHYCGHAQDVPQKCSCGSENSFIQYGVGVERVAEELLRKIPNVRIGVASSDTIPSLDKIEELIRKINDQQIDVIIGTQILAKGHHFPGITLVGIVDGDLGLQGADVRSSEKMYQLVNQVSGRAGRGEKKGEILIQTFNPDHPLYVALQNGENEKFIDMEIKFRRQHELPPFYRFTSIIISGTNKTAVEETAKMLKKNSPKNIEVFGPSPAPIALLRGRVRWRILLKSKGIISKIVRRWISSLKIPRNVRVQLDVDPINFL